MVTNNIYRSDLPKLYNLVQNTQILYPKELIIATLRDYFAKDTWYRFSMDPYGYPQTPDHTDLPQEAGITDHSTSRVFIGESHRYDISYYPAIIVRSGGTTSVPISMNRESGSIQWDYTTFIDGKGNFVNYKSPKSFIFAGAWEGTINIDVITKDLRSRDDLVEAISMFFTDFHFKDLVKSGLIVKPISVSAPSETLDRTDMFFKQTVTLPIRSEWRREIPVGNLVDIINFVVEFSALPSPPGVPAANLTIKYDMTFEEMISNL